MNAYTGESDLKPYRGVLAAVNTADLVAAGLLGDTTRVGKQPLDQLSSTQAVKTVPQNWRGLREGQPISTGDFLDYGGLL